MVTGAGVSNAAVGDTISAHSHWDVHQYSDHEIQLCYEPIAKTAAAGSLIAHVPMREVDSQNFMDLLIRTDGIALKRRVAGSTVTVTPTFSTAHTFGPGSDIMLDVTMIGSTFTVYELLPGLARGDKWYQWTDPTYPTGVNISYYTVPGWQGLWDFVHAFPVNGGIGEPHDINGLSQDARNHQAVGTEATFDDPTPASGGATDIGTSSTFGLASGVNYTYTLSVTGAGTGYMDFRDPGAASNSKFFQAGWYRFTPGSTAATVKRYTGIGTLAATYTASSGGAGAYTLSLTGPNIVVKKGAATILTVNDPAGNSSGLRVRVAPASGQAFTWTGTVN